DARFLVFSTRGTPQEIMEHDTCIGAVTKCTPQTALVSVNTSGQSSSGASPTVSSNGRFVTFTSGANDLVAAPCQTINEIPPQCTFATYLRDTCFGASANCQPSTIRVSVADDGEEANWNNNGAAQVSDEGRFVLFESAATNLIHPSAPPNSGLPIQLYMRDTCWNAPGTCVPHTYLVSAALDGSPANGLISGGQSMSSDGAVVVFSS